MVSTKVGQPERCNPPSAFSLLSSGGQFRAGKRVREIKRACNR